MAASPQPIIDVGQAFYDPCGIKRKGVVIARDTFENGPGRWVQLVTPDSTKGTTWGTVNWLNEPGRLAVRTPPPALSTAMAIRRMTNDWGDGRYLVEFKLSIENVIATAGNDRPQYFDFGVDTALADGTRRYFKVRFLNYDETGAVQVQKFQLWMGAAWVDLPGGTTFPWMTLTNENKPLPMYVALLFNTLTGCYEGFRLGRHIMVGKLAPNPDNSLINLGVAQSSQLTTFADGLNSCVEIVNRNAASQSAGQINVHHHELTYFGG